MEETSLTNSSTFIIVPIWNKLHKISPICAESYIVSNADPRPVGISATNDTSAVCAMLINDGKRTRILSFVSTTMPLFIIIRRGKETWRIDIYTKTRVKGIRVRCFAVFTNKVVAVGDATTGTKAPSQGRMPIVYGWRDWTMQVRKWERSVDEESKQMQVWKWGRGSRVYEKEWRVIASYQRQYR